MALVFTAFMEERGSIGTLEGWRMNLPSLFFFSSEAMKRNSISVLPSKQRLHKLCFLQKLGCQNPAGTRLDSSSLVNKQVGGGDKSILQRVGQDLLPTGLTCLFCICSLETIVEVGL